MAFELFRSPTLTPRRVASRQKIAAMWKAGATLDDIAAALSRSRASVQAEISHMRNDGMEVAYRKRGAGTSPPIH